MSNRTKILRAMYGTESKPKLAKSKYAFYREEEAKRGDVRRRAAVIFDAELERREQRRHPCIATPS